MEIKIQARDIQQFLMSTNFALYWCGDRILGASPAKTYLYVDVRLEGDKCVQMLSKTLLTVKLEDQPVEYSVLGDK